MSARADSSQSSEQAAGGVRDRLDGDLPGVKIAGGDGDLEVAVVPDSDPMTARGGQGEERFACSVDADQLLGPDGGEQLGAHGALAGSQPEGDRGARCLEAGELDLALIYDHEALPDIARQDLERTPLLDDVFRAVLRTGHRLNRRRRPLELSDLSGEPWIGGAPTSAWHRIVGHACRRAGFEPQVGFASDDHIAVQALAAAGLGVSVIPGLAVAHPLPGLEVRTLGSGAPVRHISAARPRDAYHGPAVTAMLESLRVTAQAVASNAGRHERTDTGRAPLATTRQL